MANGGDFRWTSDTLRPHLAEFDSHVLKTIRAATEYAATRGQGYAKATARWHDRTGNARQGLRAFTVHEARGSTIVIAHGVPYGIYLEVRFSGRYAIIMPTLRFTGELAMRMVGELYPRNIRG